MLQSFYARALYSKSKKHKFYDAKAVELVDRIDYDFSLAEKDSTMGTGVIARTIVFDELVKVFIDKNLPGLSRSRSEERCFLSSRD